jgi:putative membrane protein
MKPSFIATGLSRGFRTSSFFGCHGPAGYRAADSAFLAANQGLYNGFLAAGLVWGLVQGVPSFAFQIKIFFLLCVIVAGVYGAATVSRRILFVQAAPAAIALALLRLA